MSKRLDENLGTVDYDGLIVTNEPVADGFTVTIRKEASAEATLKRGTVLALSGGTAGDECEHRDQTRAHGPFCKRWRTAVMRCRRERFRARVCA